MANVDVIKASGDKGGSVALDPAVFEAPVKPHLFHAEVRRQLAARRAGTHSTKNRSAVSGGGAKPYRQKGTGRARQGTIRAPQFSGGGVVFGPVPRSYDHHLPRKVRRAALRSAVSLRQAGGDLLVADAPELTEFKTRAVRAWLDTLGIGSSVLIVVDEPEPRLVVSARNLRGVDVIQAVGLNVYDVLRHTKLVLTPAAVEAVARRLGDDAQAEAAS